MWKRMTAVAAIALFPAWPDSGIDLPGFFADGEVFSALSAKLAAALDAAPESPDLLFLQAYVHHFSGRPEVGAALFRYLLDVDPDHRAAIAFLQSRPARQ